MRVPIAPVPRSDNVGAVGHLVLGVVGVQATAFMIRNRRSMGRPCDPRVAGTDGFEHPVGRHVPNVMTIEYFSFFDREEPEFEVERIGDPIVQGEGPWYVSVAENWEYPAQQVQYESIYTYVVVVDTDDVLRIDDAYWVGHSVVMDDNS